jgi:hypothetical protein
MAIQKEVAAHLFMTSKWVGELVKKRILPSDNRKCGMDVGKCREAYIAYLKGINFGSIKRPDEPELDKSGQY